MPFGVVEGIGLAGGLLGGLLGGQEQPQLPPELQWVFNFDRRLAMQLLNNSKRAPLALRGERAALGADLGALGQQQQQQYQALQAAMGGGAQNPLAGSTGDALGRLQASQTGQAMQVRTAHLQGSMARRQQAKLGAAQVANQAAAAAGGARMQQPGGPDLAGIFGSLASNISYMQRMKAARESLGANTGAVGMAQPNPGATPGSAWDGMTNGLRGGLSGTGF